MNFNKELNDNTSDDLPPLTDNYINDSYELRLSDGSMLLEYVDCDALIKRYLKEINSLYHLCECLKDIETKHFFKTVSTFIKIVSVSPASRGDHDNNKGGLIFHSLNAAIALLDSKVPLIQEYKKDFKSRLELVILGLCHDLGKIITDYIIKTPGGRYSFKPLSYAKDDSCSFNSLDEFASLHSCVALRFLFVKKRGSLHSEHSYLKEIIKAFTAAVDGLDEYLSSAPVQNSPLKDFSESSETKLVSILHKADVTACLKSPSYLKGRTDPIFHLMSDIRGGLLENTKGAFRINEGYLVEYHSDAYYKIICTLENYLKIMKLTENERITDLKVDALGKLILKNHQGFDTEIPYKKDPLSQHQCNSYKDAVSKKEFEISISNLKDTAFDLLSIDSSDLLKSGVIDNIELLKILADTSFLNLYKESNGTDLFLKQSGLRYITWSEITSPDGLKMMVKGPIIKAVPLNNQKALYTLTATVKYGDFLKILEKGLASFSHDADGSNFVDSNLEDRNLINSDPEDHAHIDGKSEPLQSRNSDSTTCCTLLNSSGGCISKNTYCQNDENEITYDSILSADTVTSFSFLPTFGLHDLMRGTSLNMVTIKDSFNTLSAEENSRQRAFSIELKKELKRSLNRSGTEMLKQATQKADQAFLCDCSDEELEDELVGL